MNSQSKGLSMLGLAMKAGKVSSGEFATEQAVKSGSAYLVILAETASANTQKKFRNMVQPIYNRLNMQIGRAHV